MTTTNANINVHPGFWNCTRTCRAVFYSSCLCTAAAIYATASKYPNGPLSLETFAENPITTWQENPKVTAIGIGLLVTVEPIYIVTKKIVLPTVKTVFWDYLQMTTGVALGCLGMTALQKLCNSRCNS